MFPESFPIYNPSRGTDGANYPLRVSSCLFIGKNKVRKNLTGVLYSKSRGAYC